MTRQYRTLHVTRLDITVMVVSAVLVLLVALLQLVAAQQNTQVGYLLYLTPAKSRATNIWQVDAETLANARQITFSETGIQSFAVSPNGRWVVYAEYTGETPDTRLVLLSVVTGQTQVLTACDDSSCENPVFSPDSRYVAYERITLNRAMPQLPASPPRIWLVDLLSPNLTEQPLETEDTQILGRMVRWSQDGRRVAVFDRAASGIRLYDMQQRTSAFIARSYGTSGAFTPDDSALIYPSMQGDLGEIVLTVQRFDLVTETLETVTIDVDDFHPLRLEYSPDGAHLAGLHLTDEANCYSGPALYLARLDASGVPQTITATDHCVSHMVWDASGERLFLQRVMVDESGNSEVELWQYTLSDHSVRRIISDGYHVRWLPAVR